MNELVLIKDLQIYGNIKKSWNTNEGINYIIEDFLGIEHERYEHEIEFVNSVEDSIKKAKCNLPLEMLIDLFNRIDKRYKLTIEVSQKKENDHSDIIVPFVFVKYGGLYYDKINKKYEDIACIIKDGKLILPDNRNYICENNEYECCIWCYDSDVKTILFELYMNIITRLKNGWFL